MKNFFLTVSLLTLIFACQNKRSIEWVATTPDGQWESQDIGKIEVFSKEKPDVVVEIEKPKQTIDGFGACFNELGWTSLSLLSETDRESIVKELFEKGTGANFTICRMPVGANDFSRNWYSYNETEDDFEMKNFSIDNDKETLIPFIKSALKYNSDLKIWASPWCPPSWMKYNKHYACNVSGDRTDEKYRNDLRPDRRGGEGTNMFIQEDTYFQSYALYFAKFIEAYRSQNIPIFMIMPQNEFNSCQVFPSCTWTAEGLNKFIGGFLGPQMKNLGVEVMLGTIERANTLLVDTILKDDKSSRYISGAAFQWAGKGAIKMIHENYPKLKIYQSEQECGNGKNDWKGCTYSWELMKHYINNGTSVYDYWNISLEEGGISRWGWSQNSLVTVNREAKTYKYTYEYYLLKHISHFVYPGAQLLTASGDFSDLLAFQNADGQYVIVVYNSGNAETKKTIAIGDVTLSVTLQPLSFNTIIL
ncbi:MAG: beta-glycosidase [Tannerella sp.]|jgi:glucosylceramidase|nr:beta-glycosidase [Tannerella sp.]